MIDGTTYLWLSERVREAQRQWPVDTGKSRRGLQAIRARGGGKVVGRVSYTGYVHRKGETQRSWEVLIRQPILVRRKELLTLIRQAVVRHMGGGRGR